MNKSDWEHYGTHHDAVAAENSRRPSRETLDANHALFLPFELVPSHERESWETLANCGVVSFMVLVRRDTGEIQRWVSKTRRSINIWKNRNHPQFPWEIIMFIKITK